MTKCIVLGEVQNKKKELEPITFSKQLRITHEVVPKMCEPEEFWHIELVGPNYDGDGTDLMFAYDDPQDREDGVLFLGKWNDGVVLEDEGI